MHVALVYRGDEKGAQKYLDTCGKVTLGVCGIVILVTYLFMLKFTKPIEYKG